MILAPVASCRDCAANCWRLPWLNPVLIALNICEAFIVYPLLQAGRQLSQKRRNLAACGRVFLGRPHNGPAGKGCVPQPCTAILGLSPVVSTYRYNIVASRPQPGITQADFRRTLAQASRPPM